VSAADPERRQRAIIGGRERGQPARREETRALTRIKLEFEKGGTFAATLLEAEAPRTCEIIGAHLPFSYRFHHSIVSGQALVTLPPDLTVPRENQRVAGTPPGTLAFLVRDEPVLVPDEIYIAYGIFISRGLTVDARQPVNVFAQIAAGLDELAQVGHRVLMSGAEMVRFSRADATDRRRPAVRGRPRAS
jgi:Protein of unknown function (DUF3830)